MAPWGVINGRIKLPVQASGSCHAVYTSIREDQMFYCIYASHLGCNSGSLRWPLGPFRFDLHGKRCQSLGFAEDCSFLSSLYALTFLPPPLHAGLHLSLAAGLRASILFMSSILFCGWCRMHVFAAIPPTTSLAAPHLQFNRAKLQDHCWFLHSFLMFAPILPPLMLVYNQINVVAVLNKTVNQTWAQLNDTQSFYI